MISSVVFLIFGILSVQLFAGKLYHCSETSGTVNGTVVTVATKADCAQIGAEWINQTYNYDDLIHALLTLFYVSSFDGWVDVMFYTMDAKGVDMQPEQDYNEGIALFFVLFLLIANFFILNMFVGVIVDSFQVSTNPDEAQKAVAMRIRNERREKKQEERYDYCLKVYRLNLGYFSKRIVAMVESDAFDHTITLTIILNVLSMMIEFHDQPGEMTTTLIYCNYMFTTVFAIEAALKMRSFGVTCYFCDAWNKFDFFIVIMSFVGILVDEVIGPDAGLNPAFIRVMRVFRIARILKLVKSARGLQALLETTVKSLAQVASVGLLLFLIFFIYAAAGVAMYGRLSCTPSNECNGLSIHANFENFGIAMLTLFRIMTGDNGNGILKDALRTAPNCNDTADCKSNCCADPYIAPFFFLSFTVCAQFVLLNVVVAVLMAQLEEAQSEQQEQDEAAERDAEAKAQKDLAESIAAEEAAARQAELKGSTDVDSPSVPSPQR